jgi:hypothetical protein
VDIFAFAAKKGKGITVTWVRETMRAPAPSQPAPFNEGDVLVDSRGGLHTFQGASAPSTLDSRSALP